MSTVQVETPGGSYPIHVAAGRLAELAQSIPSDATAIAIVTNPTVASYYAERVEQALVQTGKRVLRIELPDRSEEHTSELQSLMRISYAVFCLKKKNTHKQKT